MKPSSIIAHVEGSGTVEETLTPATSSAFWPELKVTLVTGAAKLKLNKPFEDPDCWSPLSIAVVSVASRLPVYV